MENTDYISKPTLAALSFVLRNKDLWPAGFQWDFGSTKECAMGLAHRLWPADVPEPFGAPETGSAQMAGVFKIPYQAADDIFYGSTRSYPYKLLWMTLGVTPRRDVTPEMVAGAIDKYVAGTL